MIKHFLDAIQNPEVIKYSFCEDFLTKEKETNFSCLTFTLLWRFELAGWKYCIYWAQWCCANTHYFTWWKSWKCSCWTDTWLQSRAGGWEKVNNWECRRGWKEETELTIYQCRKSASSTRDIVGLVWTFCSVMTLSLLWAVHHSLLGLHSLRCQEESCHCCCNFANSEGPAWGTEIPLDLHWILVKMRIKHSGTASGTVEECRGQQQQRQIQSAAKVLPLKFSPQEWTYVVCWCPKRAASMLHPAGENPGKLLEL